MSWKEILNPLKLTKSVVMELWRLAVVQKDGAWWVKTENAMLDSRAGRKMIELGLAEEFTEVIQVRNIRLTEKGREVANVMTLGALDYKSFSKEKR